MSMRQKVTPYKNLDVDETGVVISARPTKLRYFYIYNNATSDRYLKLYDKATAATASDTPIHTLPIPAKSGALLNALASEIPVENGLSMRATTAIADNDTGAPGTNDVVVNIGIVENLDYTL